MVGFCLGKEKEKPLGVGEEPGDQWGGKITVIFWSENESPINCVHEKRSFINT